MEQFPVLTPAFELSVGQFRNGQKTYLFAVSVALLLTFVS